MDAQELDLLHHYEVVGNRFARITHPAGLRFGTVVDLETTPYNKFYKVHFDGDESDVTSLYLAESVTISDNFVSTIVAVAMNKALWDMAFEEVQKEQAKLKQTELGKIDVCIK